MTLRVGGFAPLGAFDHSLSGLRWKNQGHWSHQYTTEGTRPTWTTTRSDETNRVVGSEPVLHIEWEPVMGTIETPEFDDAWS